MPTTPILALPYPATSDPPTVPADMQELAERIETVRGAATGLASLGSDGKVPTAQLPADALTQIFDSTLGAAAASFDITSIPATYNHLRLVLLIRATEAVVQNQVVLRFNGDTAANYSWQRLYGQAATPAAAETAGDTRALAGWYPAASAAANMAGVVEMLIPHYRTTTFYKSFSALSGYGGNAGQIMAGHHAGAWASVAVINRITLSPASGNWVAGSRCTLYGVT